MKITMKRATILWVAILLVVLATTAFAENTATQIPSTLSRGIDAKGRSSNGGFPENPVIPGESSTTGLPTTKTQYAPILVQIDNSLDALPQWGIFDADIMYELPIQGQGWTRLTALFSDKYPQEAGPVRSGRVMHAELREEWDALLVHYGKQENAGSDMRETLKEHGVNAKGLDIDGIGNKYKDYFARVKYHAAPHNVTAYIDNLSQLPAVNSYQFPLRPFRFADEIAYEGLPATTINFVHQGNKSTRSTFVYDEGINAYYRYTDIGAYFDLLKPANQLSYSNIIVQRTKLTFNNHSMAPMLRDVVGKGACEIFIAGKYIAGVWERRHLSDRTVFFDQNGNEIALQRGKTWIMLADTTTDILIGTLNQTNSSIYSGEPLDETMVVMVDERGEFENFDEGSNNNTDATLDENPSLEKVDSDSAPNSQDKGVSKENTEPTFQQEPAVVGEDAGSAKQMAQVSVKNNGLLNVRKGPSKTSDIVDRVKNGAYVEVLGTQEEWTNILYEGIKGYVLTSFLDTR